MSDIFSILRSNYVAMGALMQDAGGKYVPVDPAAYEGQWTGTYADGKTFRFQISNVEGFRAQVKYQSGSTVKYQQVLVKNDSFRIGDTKFMLAGAGKAQIRNVVTNPATGGYYLDTAYAKQA